MKDLEKIKEFFLKDRAMTAAYEGNTEYFKPVIRKDKNSPSILYVDIAYPEGSGVLSIGGSKTMSGQDRETGAEKAMKEGEKIRQILISKFNLEDHDVNDLKNGKVQVFAISSDFDKMTTDNFKEIISPSLNEATGESLYKDWDQFEKPSKIKVYLNNGKTLEISPLKLKGGKRVYDAILQAFIDDRFDITNKVIQGMMNNLSEAKEEDKKFHIQQAKDKYNKLQQAFLKIENPSDSLVKQLEKAEQEYKDLIKPTISEAKKEDAVDTITMDVPLFIRMLEYSREDAAEDMDLHDVTEKAISLGKKRGILQMDDYDEIIGTIEKVNESIKRKISEALDKINEELCPKGKAYRQRRIAAGEKSSAYLSGRAVKVCKGQMSGKKKKK